MRANEALAPRGRVDAPEEQRRTTLIDGLCAIGLGVFGAGVCLHACAAAIALVVGITMVLLAFTRGSAAWAAGIGLVLVVTACTLVAVCRRRSRESGSDD